MGESVPSHFRALRNGSGIEAAYSLARAEYAVAIAIDAVAVKSRAAAVSDTYANQGTHFGAYLQAYFQACRTRYQAEHRNVPIFENIFQNMFLHFLRSCSGLSEFLRIQ